MAVAGSKKGRVSATRINFQIPEYEGAIEELTNNVSFGFHMLEPFFANFAPQLTEHCGPIRSVRGDAPTDQPMDKFSVEATLSLDTVRSCNVEEYAVFLAEFSKKRLEAMAPGFFERMNETLTAVGNSFDAGGQPFTYSLYLKMLESLELSFDENGEPILPQLHCNAEMADKIKSCQPTEDEKYQLRDLLERKKQDYFAKKRTRRLSQRDQKRTSI